MKIILILTSFLIMGGCAKAPRGYLGSGIDLISISKCAKCNMPPFYIDGKIVVSEK